MSRTRFSVAKIVALVGIVALNLAVARYLSAGVKRHRLAGQVWEFGSSTVNPSAHAAALSSWSAETSVTA